MNHSLIVARKTLLVLGRAMLKGLPMCRGIWELVRRRSLFHLVREELDLLLGDAGLAVQNCQ
jgi:hypothetical protein